jgi:hypothetical protein
MRESAKVKDLRDFRNRHGNEHTQQSVENAEPFTPEAPPQPQAQPETCNGNTLDGADAGTSGPEDQPPGQNDGPDTDPEIPGNVFPIPAGGISYTHAAKTIFPVIAKSRRLFMRDGTPHEVVSGAGKPDHLVCRTLNSYS